MENIIFSANVVLPLLIIMLSGSIAKQKGILTDAGTKNGNDLIFKLFLPMHIFCNIYTSDFASLSSSVNLFMYVSVSITLVFIVGTLVSVILEKDNRRRGVMIQGMGRTNYAMLGIPLLQMLFEGQDVGIGALLVAVVVPLFNIFSVGVLTYFGTKNANIKLVLKEIIKNPLIIASIIGLTLALTGIKIPSFIFDSIKSMSTIATPFALFLLGSSFELKKVKNVIKPLIITVLARLFIIPLIVLGIGVSFGFRDIELGCLLIVFASPAAAASYTMSVKMGGDEELASSVVIFTSVLCTFSLFLFIAGLKSLGLM